MFRKTSSYDRNRYNDDNKSKITNTTAKYGDDNPANYLATTETSK